MFTSIVNNTGLGKSSAEPPSWRFTMGLTMGFTVLVLVGCGWCSWRRRGRPVTREDALYSWPAGKLTQEGVYESEPAQTRPHAVPRRSAPAPPEVADALYVNVNPTAAAWRPHQSSSSQHNQKPASDASFIYLNEDFNIYSNHTRLLSTGGSEDYIFPDDLNLEEDWDGAYQQNQ